MGTFVGEIAALLAALGFSFTSVCYTFAGAKNQFCDRYRLKFTNFMASIAGHSSYHTWRIFPHGCIA